jgi:hypothetical protein
LGEEAVRQFRIAVALAVLGLRAALHAAVAVRRLAHDVLRVAAMELLEGRYLRDWNEGFENVSLAACA